MNTQISSWKFQPVLRNDRSMKHLLRLIGTFRVALVNMCNPVPLTPPISAAINPIVGVSDKVVEVPNLVTPTNDVFTNLRPFRLFLSLLVTARFLGIRVYTPTNY